MTYDDYLKILNAFHTGRADNILDYETPLAGDTFAGEFNVSGYHQEILDLSNNPRSLWGVDRCLRVQDIIDDFHSLLFHMGIYAESIDLQDNFSEPLKDEKYRKLQDEIFEQFFGLLEKVGVVLSELEVSVAGRIMVGGTKEGRDSYLARPYSLGPDTHLKEIIEAKGIKVSEVSGLANVDIHPVDGALVGLRCEVAYRGVEIATLVFDTFKITDTHLEPINYVGGYAFGIERLYALLKQGTIVTTVPRYVKASALLMEVNPNLSSKLVQYEYLQLLYGLEVVARLPIDGPNIPVYSPHQKQRLRAVVNQVKTVARELGIDDSHIQMIKEVFKAA